MDRLGPTLATWADSMRYTHPHSHLREQVSAVGRKLLRLLQGLHEKGDIHGDVKPENFLVPFKPNGDQGPATNIDMVRHDPVMVDLGFSSSWRKKGSDKHIDYSQALGQFHGTTRYASLHCHAGRTLARRDDLESLGYTVLYLLQGRLPWQGQEGADKEQRDQKVLRIKGSMTPSAICATAPPQVRTRERAAPPRRMRRRARAPRRAARARALTPAGGARAAARADEVLHDVRAPAALPGGPGLRVPRPLPQLWRLLAHAVVARAAQEPHRLGGGGGARGGGAGGDEAEAREERHGARGGPARREAD